MSARFLVRFDDICPTMNWAIWERIEFLLDRYSVKPILAIVPDNQDPHLVVNTANGDFWQRVRQWQAKGWTIGLHGYRHIYETDHAGLLGLNARSEFAGVDKQLQAERISNGIAIMQREGVAPQVWVAPGHSFDANTIDVLITNGITVLSDGFFLRPARDRGALWIPQQLWRFRSFPFGLWTVCHHHNSFRERDVLRMDADLSRYRSQIVSVNEVLSGEPIKPIDFLDRLTSAFWLRAIKVRRWVGARET